MANVQRPLEQKKGNNMQTATSDVVTNNNLINEDIGTGGQAQQFSPSNYRYTSYTSGPRAQRPRKHYGGWIVLGVGSVSFDSRYQEFLA